MDSSDGNGDGLKAGDEVTGRKTRNSKPSSSETPKAPKGRKKTNNGIGNLTIEQTNTLISEICGYQGLNLNLPFGTEKKELKEVIVKRYVCMICMENPSKSSFKTHLKTCHPTVDSDISKIMIRMSDIRYTRFCTNCVVTDDFLEDYFPDIPKKKLVNFFSSLGFVVLSNEIVIKNVEKIQQMNTTNRTAKEEKQKIDWEKKYKEKTVCGVAKARAIVFLKEMNPLAVFHPEFEFAESLITNEKKLNSASYSVRFCHLCHKHFHGYDFDVHVKWHAKTWPEIQKFISVECTISDVLEALRRLADVRRALYYASNPVRNSRIQQVCQNDDTAQKKMAMFLVRSGFVIDMEEKAEVIAMSPSFMESTSIVPFVEGFEPRHEISEEKTEEVTQDDTSDTMSECSSTSETISSSRSVRSRSGSVSSSDGSSASSRISLKDATFPTKDDFPYCVLNAIPHHIEVEHALFDLLEVMTDDLDYKLNQFEYNFLIGYAMYTLVVGNGCKLNVIARMTMEDYRNAKIDANTRLTYFSYTTKSTCIRETIQEFVCADERILRALEVYEVARERRVKELRMMETMMEDESTFFVTFTSLAAMQKDASYPMSQFLRMCGIHWSCRGSNICSAAWSLLPRDNSKVGSANYVITYFQNLREKEIEQIGYLENPNVFHHPTLKKLTSIRITMKKRKTLALHERKRKKQKRYNSPERRGRLPRKRGGDHKSKSYLKSIGKWTSPEREEEPSTSREQDDSTPDEYTSDDYSSSDGFPTHDFYNPTPPPPLQYPYFEADSNINTQTEFVDQTVFEPGPMISQEYRTENVDDKVMTCL